MFDDFMKQILLRRLIIPFFLLIAMYVVVTMVAERVTIYYFGWFAGDRMLPYYSVHLSEELSEGSYSPFFDPVFVIYTIMNGLLSFGASGFYAAVGIAARCLMFSIIPAILVILSLVFFNIQIIVHEEEKVMLSAFYFQVFSYLSCAIAGSLVGYRYGRGGSRDPAS